MRCFFKSFGYAGRGLIVFFRHERNAKVQLIAGILAVMLGLKLNISAHEWIYIAGCIAIVLSFEMMNSAIEKACNLIHPGYHPAIKCIKDISAGAVLCVSLFSVVIAAIIFLPKITLIL